MKAAHRNIKPCCKLSYYSRVLNNGTCTIIFFQPNFPYVRSLLGTVWLLLWANCLSCTFILNCTINRFKHFFSNCLNTKKNKNIKFVIISEVVRFHTIWRKMTFTISVMILKSESPGYHFTENTLLHKSYFSVFAYWTGTIKWASSSNRVELCINLSLITSAESCLIIFCIFWC